MIYRIVGFLLLVCVSLFVCVCMCVCLCVCVCMYMCLYLYFCMSVFSVCVRVYVSGFYVNFFFEDDLLYGIIVICIHIE